MALTAKGTPYVVSTDLVANYPTVSSDLANHIDDNLGYNAVTINAQTGSGANAYTFALADASEGKLVTASNAAAATYTVPPQSSVTWADGAVLRILNQGAGVVTIAAGAGVTINGSPLTLNQYQSAQINRTASNTWTMVKNGGSGKILQIVRATDTTLRSTTSTTFVDVTGMSVTITPTLSTSAVMIIATYVYNIARASSTLTNGAVRITDNSGNAISGAERANLQLESASATLNLITPAVQIAYATPATTSAVTYKLQFLAGTSTTTRINNDVQTGQMFAIEVGA